MADEIRKILNDATLFNEVVKAAFGAVDTDGSGCINSNELSNAMTLMSADAGIPAPNQAQCDEAMKALDTNNDGKITSDEFAVLVRAILESIASE